MTAGSHSASGSAIRSADWRFGERRESFGRADRRFDKRRESFGEQIGDSVSGSSLASGSAIR